MTSTALHDLGVAQLAAALRCEGKAERTVRLALARLSTLLRWAERQDLVELPEGNPCRGVELGACAKAGIGEAGVLQLTQGVLVQIQAIVLVVGAFVPLEPQPGQIVNQLSGKFRALAAIVQVLDTQHDAAALAAGRKPRAQAAEHVAQVHAARDRKSVV